MADSLVKVMSSEDLNFTETAPATNENFFCGDFNTVIVDGLVDNRGSEQVSENNNKSALDSDQKYYSSESGASSDSVSSSSSPATARVVRISNRGIPSQSSTNETGETAKQGSFSYFLSFDEDSESANLKSDAEPECRSIGSSIRDAFEENTNQINVNNYQLIKSRFGEASSDRPDRPLSSHNYLRSGQQSWESSLTLSDQQGTSLESSSSWTVSFLTEIEVKATHPNVTSFTSLRKENAGKSLNMETSEVQSSDKSDKEPVGEEAGEEGDEEKVDDEVAEAAGESEQPPEASPSDVKDQEGIIEEEEDDVEEESYVGGEEYEEGGDACGGDEEEDDDTTTLSSEAVVDDIELILMPEMCHDLQSSNLSPKLVRVTELKLNADDVFCDDDETDEDQSSRHEFRSIVDEVCEEEEVGAGGGDGTGRLSIGDDDVSSGSELISGSGRRHAGETSKSSSSSGRRRRSTSGRINSGVQTEITALDEPKALSGHGFRKKASGKSSRLGVPGGGSANGKKLNWKSELTLLPSKMKVKQSSFNSFEGNDERDQYSPRVAKFTSQVRNPMEKACNKWQSHLSCE